MTILWLLVLPRTFIVDTARCKWTDRSAIEVNLENERFTVICSRCRLNLKFGNFTLLFGRLRQRMPIKCVPHVWHDYFTSFNQSHHCFLASYRQVGNLMRNKREKKTVKIIERACEVLFYAVIVFVRVVVAKVSRTVRNVQICGAVLKLIGHFWITFGLVFTASPGAYIFMGKFAFACE